MFLDRFTKTLPILHVTNGLEGLIGISSEDMQNTSFYNFIQERCFPDAVKCIESAKANDSIAYLRFWCRNPYEGDLSDGSLGLQIELKAVMSCMADGLIVIIRAARPFALDSFRQSSDIAEPRFRNGLFASPWALEPLIPTTGEHIRHETYRVDYLASGAPDLKRELIAEPTLDVPSFLRNFWKLYSNLVPLLGH